MKESRKQYLREWRLAHLEQQREACRRWARENRQYRLTYNREYRKRNKDRVKAWNLKQRLKDPEKIRLKARLYREGHLGVVKQKARERHKRTYPVNRLKILQQTKDYAQKNPEIRRKCALNYRARHPQKHKAQQRAAAIRRKVRLRGADVGDPNVDRVIRNQKRKPFFICYYCKKLFGSEHLTVDHVKPISLGGKHTVGNICWSCLTCNVRKRHHPLSEMKFLDQPVLNL